MSGRPSRTPDLLRQFNPVRILAPILLGSAILGYVLYSELGRGDLNWAGMLDSLPWSSRASGFLWLAAFMVIVREFGYIWQIRLLTDGRLSWTACFQVVVLWNFFAAVSPSVVGGTALGVFMLMKEGLSVGRTTAIVFTTVFLDQFFYTTIPVGVSLWVPQDDIFAPLRTVKLEWVGTGMVAAFWSAWGGLLAYVLFLIAALFVAPGWIHWWLVRLLRLPGLRRWGARGLHMTDDLLIASRDLRRRSARFWLAVFLATSLAWFGRYWILNAVLGAFSPVPMGFYDYVLASARQAVLWVLMVISPTPGSAGVAELGFSWMFRDLAPDGSALPLAIIWRSFSYYPYLILGVPIMTRWIRRIYGRDVRD